MVRGFCAKELISYDKNLLKMYAYLKKENYYIRSYNKARSSPENFKKSDKDWYSPFVSMFQDSSDLLNCKFPKVILNEEVLINDLEKIV